MPNRIIKESICTSDSVDKLSWFEEVLFYRLIVNCDDYGRYDGRPAIIKNRIFPLKNKLSEKTVKDAILSLVKADLILYYVADGRPYIQLKTWEDHQSIRAKKSKYPSPYDDNCKHLQANEIICEQMYANVPVIQSNRNPIQSNTDAREDTHAHGEYGWIKLTEEQYSKLLKDLGEAELRRCIKYIDESAQQTGNKNRWRDWNLVIRKCSREGWGKAKQTGRNIKASCNNYPSTDTNQLLSAIDKI